MTQARSEVRGQLHDHTLDGIALRRDGVVPAGRAPVAAPALVLEPIGAIADELAERDYLRRSPFASGGPGGHKEWLRFNVLAPGLDVLIEFQLADDVRLAARRGAEYGRVTVLLRRHEWEGDVETFIGDDVRVAERGVDLTLGDNRCALRDGVFHVDVTLRHRAIRVLLEVRSITCPALMPHIPLPYGPPLHWVVVPRVVASGAVTIDGRTARFVDAPGYHDHRWGHFLWGQDMAWHWGFALPAVPTGACSLAFARLTHHADRQPVAQGLFLWLGREQRRVFRDDQIAWSTGPGLVQPADEFTMPRPLDRLPLAAAAVPSEIELHAAADGDRLTCRVVTDDIAQVIVPGEARHRATVIRHVYGTVSVDGEIGGAPVAWGGRTVLELLDG